MDYSYVPQMYQQGVTHNLDKQFQLAGQAQPVTQFLASLRQAKQMELQQQVEEDRQRRLDIQQAQQEALNKRYMAQADIGIAGEADKLLDGTEAGYNAARGLADRAGAGDLVKRPTTRYDVAPPSFKSVTTPGLTDADRAFGKRSILANPDVTEDQVLAPDTEQSLPNLQKRTDSLSVDMPATIGDVNTTRTFPKGTVFQQKEAELAGKNQRAADAHAIKLSLGETANKIRQQRADFAEDVDSPQNRARVAAATHLEKESARIQRELDTGMIEKKEALMQAQAAHASAASTLANAGARIKGLEADNFLSDADKLIYQEMGRESRFNAAEKNKAENNPFRPKSAAPPTQATLPPPPPTGPKKAVITPGPGGATVKVEDGPTVEKQPGEGGAPKVKPADVGLKAGQKAKSEDGKSVWAVGANGGWVFVKNLL